MLCGIDLLLVVVNLLNYLRQQLMYNTETLIDEKKVRRYLMGIPNDYTCKMKKGCNLPSTVVGTNRFSFWNRDSERVQSKTPFHFRVSMHNLWFSNILEIKISELHFRSIFKK